MRDLSPFEQRIVLGAVFVFTGVGLTDTEGDPFETGILMDLAVEVAVPCSFLELKFRSIVETDLSLEIGMLKVAMFPLIFPGNRDDSV